MRLLSSLKNSIVPPGHKPRQILAGPFKGIKMDLSLQTQSQLYLGLFERETHPWLRRLSDGLMTAVDIGAANGEYTLFFLMKTQAKKIFAFEPDAACLPVLCENLRLNDLGRTGRLDLSTKFVGDSDSDQKLRLDSLVCSVQSPCFIKMDVEGSEEQILHGAKILNTLPDVRWLIETHSTELEALCVEILTAAGFQTRVIRNAWWRIFAPEWRRIEHNRWLAAWQNESFRK
jgi:hypothetical protein